MAVKFEDKPGYQNDGYEGASNQNTPAGDSSDPRGPDTTPAMDSSDPRGSQNPDQNDSIYARKSGVGKEALEGGEKSGGSNIGTDAGNAEASQLNDQVGEGFKPEGGSKPAGTMNQPLGKTIAGKLFGSKKKKAATGGILAIGVAGMIGWSSTIMPTKLIGITTGVQGQAFAAVNKATGDMGDNLLQHYLVQKVMPGMVKNNCTSTRVSKSCADVSNSSTPVGALYETWRGANIEKKLFENHGIEIRREGRQFFLHTPQLSERVALGNFDGNTRNFEDKSFAALNRSEVRRELRIATDNVTKRQRINMRFVVGPYMEKKYKIRRCILTCKVADKASDNIDLKKTRFTNTLTERVLLPRTDMLGLVVACATNSFDCTEFGEANENGERTNQFQQDVQARLAEHQQRFGQESLEELNKQSEALRDKGFVQFTTEKILGETAGKVATKGIPVLGWIDMGAKFISGAQNLAPAFAAMAYTVNSNSMAAVFAMYSTTADEVKVQSADKGGSAPKVDNTELGSMTGSLEHRKGADQGGASAEEHPVYKQLLNPNPLGDTKTPTSKYGPCDNGNRIPAGQVECPEETVANANTGVKDMTENISDVANSPLMGPAGVFADFWNNTAGQVIATAAKFTGDAAMLLVPGFIKDKVDDLASGVIGFITEKAIPSAVKLTSSGGRLFVMMANGAFITANDFAHYVLGAPAVSPAVAADIRSQQLAQEKEDFSRRPLYARIFDKESSNSMVNQLAVSLPDDTTSATSQVQDLVRDPIQSMASVFSSAFSSPSVKAYIQAKNPSGSTDYAYNPSDSIFKQDGDKTWKDNDCDNPDKAKNWGNESVVKIVPENYSSNPCMLVETAVAANGGLLNTNLITDYFGEDALGQPATSDGEPTGSSELVSGTDQEIAKKIMSSGKVTGDSRYMGQIQGIANGNGSCHVNPTILQLIATIAETHSIYITSLNRYCTGVLTDSGPASYHYREQGGHAVDIGNIDGMGSTGGSENDIKLLKEILPKLPPGSGIGQIGCRPLSSVTFPDGISNFGDTCDHLHIQVPPK